MSDKTHRATEELLSALEKHEEDVIAPIRQAYAEQRQTLVREHAHKELAVFDALEELREIESACSDELAASRIREVIDDLEAVF